MLAVPGERSPGTVQAIVQDSAAASLEKEQPVKSCEKRTPNSQKKQKRLLDWICDGVPFFRTTLRYGTDILASNASQKFKRSVDDRLWLTTTRTRGEITLRH